MKITRVVYYIRVSTEEQKLHGLSLDAQRMKLDEYANEHKYKFIRAYVDEGVSGRKEIKKRPQLQKMLNDAQKNEFDLIIFIKLDRYFRSVAEYHECQKILEAHDIKWATTEEKYDLTTANGRAFVNMKLTIAELEADQTGERIKLVNEYKVKEGYALSGAVPFGWCLKKENGHSRVVKHPENHKIVMECIELIERNKVVRKSIEDTYDKYELPFTYKVLRNSISTSFLYGFYRGNYNFCEPSMTKERYDNLQSIIQSKIRTIKTRRIYLFSSLVTCACCGSRCTGNFSNPYGSKEFYSYRCNYKMKRIQCKDKNQISEKNLEAYLLDHLDDIINDYLHDIELNNKTEKPKKINKKKIIEEMDRLNFMFQKNRISIEKYDIEYAELEKKLKEADSVSNVEDKDLEPLKKLLNMNIKEIYEILDREHKRAFWQSILKEIIIDGKNIKVYLKDSYN